MSHQVASVSAGPIGIGMLSLTKPGPNMPSTEEAVNILKHALDLGANLWNGSMYYGTPDYNSLHLIKAYFTKYPTDASKVIVCIKGCWHHQTGAHVRAEEVKAYIDECVKVLDGSYTIDIFQPGRLDPDVPVEETIGAIAQAVRDGKVGGIGLSECSAKSIRKAAAIHPIAAVEIELSLFETNPLSNGIAEACRDNGVALMAYTPLGKGFLTGQFKRFEDLPEGDIRVKFFPRFSKENFDQNVKLADEVDKIAQKRGCTTAQVAIAWVAAQTSTVGAPVIPIPSISSIGRAEENLKHLDLSEVQLAELNDLLKTFQVKGERTPAMFEKYLSV